MFDTIWFWLKLFGHFFFANSVTASNLQIVFFKFFHLHSTSLCLLLYYTVPAWSSYCTILYPLVLTTVLYCYCFLILFSFVIATVPVDACCFCSLGWGPVILRLKFLTDVGKSFGDC